MRADGSESAIISGKAAPVSEAVVLAERIAHRRLLRGYQVSVFE